MFKRNASLLSCEVKHMIKGRARIKSLALKYVGNKKDEIEKQLRKVKNINSVEISTVTGSMLIYFREENLSIDNILVLLENTLDSYLVEIHKNEADKNKEKYVIEKKLQNEDPKEIINKILAISAVLAYDIFKKAPLKVGVSRFFRYTTLATIGLAIPVIKEGINSVVKNKRPNAATLSSTAIVSSIILGKEKTALTIMLLEEFAELLTVYTMKKTRGAIKDMLSVGENYVWKEMEDGTLKKVAIEEVEKSDIIFVQTGEKISVDGKIVKGSALIDQSSITGEYMPITKTKGENVFAGTIIKNGSIRVEAEKVGDDRAVSRIIKLVEDANSSKAQIQSYADNFSAQLIPLNFMLAALVYIATRDTQKALTMLVIDYSCGIRLSTAVAFSAAINTAAKNGILVKGSNYLEEMSGADTVIFDKTGTITEGNPSVQTIEVFDKSLSEEEVIMLAAAAEETSTHPLGIAIMTEMKERGLNVPKHEDEVLVIARGVEVKVGDDIVRVGSEKFMNENKIATTISENAIRGILNRGEISIYISKNNDLIGLIGVTDPIKGNIKKAINRLRNKGIDDIVLLTGDLRQQAETIVEKMSLDGYKSELLPEDKAKTILSIQAKGSKVIMVGDGVNDAPALSYANVGVALGGTRTDIAMEAADITITQDNPLLVPGIIGLSKQSVKVIKENFAMAIGINSIALVLGATGILPAIYGSIIHNASTILVVGNSLRLLKYDLDK